MKRGAIELPVVMIFIMVAGALILIFFVVLAQNQGESANKSIQATSLQRLGTLLKGAATARETANNITIIDETLTFECDSETRKTRFYYESGVDTFLFNQVVFSPRELSGGQLRTYTKGVREGYRVTTALYLSTPQNIIQNATGMYDFPPNFPYRNVSDPASADPRWRLVLKEGQMGGSSIRDQVYINEQPGGYGSVKYVRYSAQGTRSEKTVHYPNHELLYGAIISPDAETYNCMVDNYLRQLQWVNKIERQRLLALKQASADASSACYEEYQEFPYRDIDDTVNKAFATGFDLDRAQELAEAAAKIQFMNDNLIRGRGGESCAWLY